MNIWLYLGALVVFSVLVVVFFILDIRDEWRR